MTQERHPPLTQTEVWDAADRLASQGKPVSQQAILRAVGHGSNSTIAKHLQSWRSKQQGNKIIESTDLPFKTPDFAAFAFFDLVDKISKEARAAAQEELAEEREAVEMARTGAALEVENIKAENRYANKLRLEAEEKVSRVNDQLMELRVRVKALTAEKSAMESEHAERVRQLRSEADRMQKQYEDANRKAIELQERLTVRENELAQAIKAHKEQLAAGRAHHDAEKAILRQQFSEHRTNAAQARDQADKAQARADLAQERADQATALIAELRSDLREAEKARRESDRVATEWRAKASSLESELSRNKQERESLNERFIEQSNDIIHMRREISRLIDPGTLLEWLENGMQPKAGKAFSDVRIRDIARIIEKKAP